MHAADLKQMLAPICELYRRDIGAGGSIADMLAEVDAALASVEGPELAPEPRQLPGCRHLAAAVRDAAGGAGEAIANAVLRHTAAQRWQQNPNYVDEAIGGGWMHNYGYFNLLGWDGFAERPNLSCGLLLLGPDLHYPPHAHPAEEIYHPLNDAAEWWREGVDWYRESAGTLIYHRSRMAHAMRTAERPLLALYCWRGELGADKPQLV